MSKLLKAGFSRLKQDNMFWLTLAASLACGAAFAGISLYENTFDGDFAVPLFLVLSVFVSLSVGQEYSSSAIRNKIIVGHTKGSIFLTELILHLSVGAAAVLLFMVPVAIGCSGKLSLAPSYVLLSVFVCMVLSGLVFSVIFTVISCLVPQKALGSILCVLLVFVMVFCSYQLEFSLFQPEKITIDTELASGEYAEEQIPNPRAVGGLKKAVFIAADSLTPNGQVNNYMEYLCLWTNAADEKTEQDSNSIDDELTRTLKDMLPYYPLYSIGLCGLLSYTGWAVFRKKDLK